MYDLKVPKKRPSNVRKMRLLNVRKMRLLMFVNAAVKCS